MNAKHLLEWSLIEGCPHFVARTELLGKSGVAGGHLSRLVRELAEEHERIIEADPKRGYRLAVLPDLPLFLEELGAVPPSKTVVAWVILLCITKGWFATVVRGLSKRPLRLLPLRILKDTFIAAEFESGRARRVEVPLSDVTAFAKIEKSQLHPGIARYLEAWDITARIERAAETHPSRRAFCGQEGP